MIIGGVSFSAVLSLFVVPVLYTLLAQMTKPSSFVADKLRTLEKEHVEGARATAASVPAE